ncbi:MAG TPA: hypothetical protein VGS01_09490 [Candidatus Limnocylindria bacterium]|nr:hypothetical protein [Candidatus Limnocylindria bacterium]
MPAGTTRFDEALFDSDAFGFDVDTTPYVNQLAIERTLRRSAAPKMTRQDDATLKRTATPRLTRRQE